MEPDISLNHSVLDEFYRIYFGYYNTLDADVKTLFTRRVLEFISEKTIVGAEGFDVNNKVKAIVAACAVQLTLGLETWRLDYFEEIVIHPSDFDNKATGLKFSGETNLGGVIKLSWKKFIAGYKVTTDNLNLGLHEFTHALRFSGTEGRDQDYFVENYFNNWLASAYEAFYDIKNGNNTIFRKYGGTNITEFVSVCIEHYFESPQEIKDRYPLLYYSTAILLNQQTVNSKTTIGIKQQMLKEKNKLLPGTGKYGLMTSVLNTKIFFFNVLVFLALLYKGVNWGFLDELGILLMLLLIILYLRLDFKTVILSVRNNYATVNHGLLIFRKRKKIEMPLTQVISINVLGTKSYEVLYYNDVDGYFYEEELRLVSGKTSEFLHELKLNKVAVLNYED
jgi:Mlc titration factor MtfA (ptsG expression regulator)